MADYIIREDAFMALTGDITDCTIEEFIARLRDKLSKLPSVSVDDVVNQRATTCRHGGHCEWVACDKCNHYEPEVSQDLVKNILSKAELVIDEDGNMIECVRVRNILDAQKFRQA